VRGRSPCGERRLEPPTACFSGDGQVWSGSPSGGHGLRWSECSSPREGFGRLGHSGTQLVGQSVGTAAVRPASALSKRPGSSWASVPGDSPALRSGRDLASPCRPAQGCEGSSCSPARRVTAVTQRQIRCWSSKVSRARVVQIRSRGRTSATTEPPRLPKTRSRPVRGQCSLSQARSRPAPERLAATARAPVWSSRR
jgi:hypothetical protein